WQSESDIDGGAKALVLQHRQPLIVIHGENRIRVFQMARREQSVSRESVAQMPAALLAQTRDHRIDDFQLFPAQMTAFSRVGIETADQNARLRNAELSH